MNRVKVEAVIDNWINGNISDCIDSIKKMTKKDILVFLVVYQDRGGDMRNAINILLRALEK